jgi:hypothetical protein
MNVKIGTVAAQFLSWEALFPIFGIGSLQCSKGIWRRAPVCRNTCSRFDFRREPPGDSPLSYMLKL